MMGRTYTWATAACVLAACTYTTATSDTCADDYCGAAELANCTVGASGAVCKCLGNSWQKTAADPCVDSCADNVCNGFGDCTTVANPSADNAKNHVCTCEAGYDPETDCGTSLVTWGPDAWDFITDTNGNEEWAKRCCPTLLENGAIPEDTNCSMYTFEPVVPPRVCEEGGSGLFLPGFEGHWKWSKQLRGVLYFVALLYMFAGVAIMADAFMGAIEQITSSDKLRKDEFGRQYITKQWNATVANLTLMALGSSAPEIILSLIEMIGKKYYSGELGPGTIVGSAAFNLMFILGICTAAIPDAAADTLFLPDEDGNVPEGGVGGIRRIQQMGVYALTAVFSVFAYLWLIVILQGNTPEVIDIWEGVVTFSFFAILTLMAWMLDAKICCKGTAKIEPDMDVADLEVGKKNPRRRASMKKFFARSHKSDKSDVVKALKAGDKAQKKKLVGEDADEFADKMTADLALHESEAPKTRAAYRQMATKQSIGGKSKAIREILGPGVSSINLNGDTQSNVGSTLGLQSEVSIKHAQYTCLENCGEVILDVTRFGNTDSEITVDYTSIDDTAQSGVHFKECTGTLNFRSGETEKQIKVIILDNDEGKKVHAEGDQKHATLDYDIAFMIKLTNPRTSTSIDGADVHIRNPFSTVTIVDDDTPGYITLETDSYRVMENHGTLAVKVIRKGGAKGKIVCKYATKDGTAVAPSDYNHCEGKLIFEEGELHHIVEINIVDDDIYERDETFTFSIMEPTGGGALGDIQKATITIENDDEMAGWLDRVTARINMNRNKFKLAAGSWGEQFSDAVRWPHDDGCSDKIIHTIMVFWKVLGATIPPPRIMGGWCCFIYSLGMIGLVTALIGDLAGLFGCVIGLSDQVTAITFVALGTSLPDTFASKMAAVHERTADAAITNVTGSNSVNVFLGLGLAWMISAIFWNNNADKPWSMKVACHVAYDFPKGAFYVKAGSLVFTVLVFCGCAVTTFIILAVRRVKVGGELGGPGKNIVCGSLMMLWVFYVILSSLKSEGVI